MKNTLLPLFLLLAILLNAQAATTFATGFTDIEGIAADLNNIIYVSEHDSGKLYSLNSDGISKEVAISLNGAPFNDFAIDEFNDDVGDYYLFVHTAAKQFLYTFDLFGSFAVIPLEPNMNIYGAYKHNYYVYFSDENSGKILKSHYAGHFEEYADGFTTPKDFAFDSNDNLYVANRGRKELVKVTPNGERFILASNIENINGVAVSALNDVYFTTYNEIFGENKILKHTADTGIISDFVATNLNKPNTIVITDLGEMYVTNKGDGTVTKITDFTLSSNNVDLANDFSIYPSITNGKATISNPKGIELLSVRTYDMNGALIKSVNNINVEHLDFSSVSSGMYFVTIETPKGRVTKNILKK